MGNPFFTFRIQNWSRWKLTDWFPKRREIIYCVDFSQALDELKNGDSSSVQCTFGMTPTAPTLMSYQGEGKFKVEDDQLTVNTSQYSLDVPIKTIREASLPAKLEAELTHNATGRSSILVTYDIDN